MRYLQEDRELTAPDRPLPIGTAPLEVKTRLSRNLFGALSTAGLTAGLLLSFGWLSGLVGEGVLPWYLLRGVTITLFVIVELTVISIVARLLEGRGPGALLRGGREIGFWLFWGAAIGLIANGIAPAVLSLSGGGWLAPLPRVPISAKVTAAVLVPLSAVWEEVVYRGCILRWLLPLGAVGALTLSSALFAGLHFLSEPLYPDRIAVLLAMGVFFGIAYLVSGNLWFPIGLHLGINIVGFILTNDPYTGGVWRFAIAVPRNIHLLLVLAGLIVGSLLALALARSRKGSGATRRKRIGPAAGEPYRPVSPGS